MKGIIKDIKYQREKPTNLGFPLHVYTANINNKDVYFEVKDKDRLPFEEGKEIHCNEEESIINGELVTKIKPVRVYNTEYKKAIRRDEAKYPSMIMSYMKDCAVSGLIKFEQIEEETRKKVRFLFDLNKEMETW